MCLACAAWWAYVGVQGVIAAFDDSFPAFVIMFAFEILLSGAVVTYLIWLAVQLWRHFSALTARLASATAVAILCLFALGGVSRVAGSPALRWLDSVATLVLIIAAPVAYRWLARAIIERTRIDDPRDAHGHPIGHMTRVKVFCVVLGWAVFLTASNLVVQLLPKQRLGIWAIVGLTPIPLALIVYRVVLWWLTPPTLVSLPPGGFEVMPARNPRNESC